MRGVPTAGVEPLALLVGIERDWCGRGIQAEDVLHRRVAESMNLQQSKSDRPGPIQGRSLRCDGRVLGERSNM